LIRGIYIASLTAQQAQVAIRGADALIKIFERLSALVRDVPAVTAGMRGKTRAMPIRLDEIDVKILQRLQEQARISNVALANLVGLSPAPCLRRVRALEEAGVIRKYVTLLDPHAVNLGVTVFVQISLDLKAEARLQTFEKAILNRTEVLACYLMTGDSDYLLQVVVPDVFAYERFLRSSLTQIEHVVGIKSSFALKQVKDVTAFPLSYADAREQSRPEESSVAPVTSGFRARRVRKVRRSRT
jgi:Lrp/AsnC family leucine-responsive transcriptional regulator